MAYLKHKDTGEVYPLNPDLIKRGDMLPCNLDGTLIEETPAEPETKPASKARTKKTVAKAAPAAEPEPVDEFMTGADFDLGDDE